MLLYKTESISPSILKEWNLLTEDLVSKGVAETKEGYRISWTDIGKKPSEENQDYAKSWIKERKKWI